MPAPPRTAKTPASAARARSFRTCIDLILPRVLSLVSSRAFFGLSAASVKQHQRGVVPAQAGTHIPETVVMGPRLRGDDSRDLSLRPLHAVGGRKRLHARMDLLLDLAPRARGGGDLDGGDSALD